MIGPLLVALFSLETDRPRGKRERERGCCIIIVQNKDKKDATVFIFYKILGDFVKVIFNYVWDISFPYF